MTSFSIDLPFFMSLDEGVYSLRIGDHELQIQHSVVQRDAFDPRIGGITAGSFGFVRDQFGALRYSRLSVDIDDELLIQVGVALTGKTPAHFDAEDLELSARRRSEAVLVIFNRFLDKYRVVTRKLDIKPIGPWDLALLTIDDGQNRGEFRLYGGSITLPIAGLIPEYERKVIEALADPLPSSAFELAAVDALRMIEDGQPLESIVSAIGALEAALDMYFARKWRLADPRVFPHAAAAELGVASRLPRNGPITVEDVLRIAGVHAKVSAYALANNMSEEQRGDLFEAIELRNLVVHGGIRISPQKGRPHVRKLASFVLDELAPRIRDECPELPRAEFHYACEELLGNDYSPHLQPIVETYLATQGLSAKLYNDRRSRLEMISERFGDALVLRISFQDFTPGQVNLFIAQALLYHYLERRGGVARALPTDDQLPWGEESRPFFKEVASELTRSVWNAAIDRRLRDFGFDALIQDQAEREATKLRDKYCRPFVEPRFEELGHWINYLPVAQIAAALEDPGRASLLEHVARFSPSTARQAAAAIPSLETVVFDDLASIRESLIRVHDANAMTLAALVSIFDPVTQQRFGWGLRLEDLGIVRLNR